LKYFWDFGDGTTMSTTSPTVTHTYSSPVYADVKLVVTKGSSSATYRQAVAVDSPTGPPPATDPCGTFSPAEAASVTAAAKRSAS
jgi:PKD repeat protein